ncbi:hypothetical protein L873DRAFT_1815517 [Choiromyces venosus 120613-1]|uniref:Tc1-like transposase DDE domain-containing protein n=1 Tax=Choiromyces venosus 120613-1 TaxID=1336337 RepID=A0A3N4J675_9PEZI|nr:hypothetical protein L873DRAFT_1815517 [Choiromyces venosus 120613-1]
MRWLREYRTTLLKIPPYSPDLNPIKNIWSLIKHGLSKYYSDPHLMKGPEHVVKKAIEEAITECWELLDSNLFDNLVGSIVDREEVIIKADGWYTKY